MFNSLKGKKIYLALPYSHSDPQVREVRYGTATSVAAYLMKQGAVVFSPITYGHQICQYGIDTNFERWAELDYPMIAWADELWLLELDGHDISFGVQEELKHAELVGTKVVRVSKQDISNFLSDTSLNSPVCVAVSVIPRVAETRYEFIVKSKYKYGDTIFVIDDDNEIMEQTVHEIAIACLQDKQGISYNGFHSELVFSSYGEAKKALETVFA